MANYFYFNRNNQKQGPISKEELKKLVAQGIIGPKTHLETDTEQKMVAEEIPGLNFHTTTFTSREHDESLGEGTGIFDIGFTRFFSNTWISIIWGIVIGVHFLGVCVALYYLDKDNWGVPLITLLATPISLLSWRMALELDVIFFRIETNTRKSKEYLREIKELLARK